MAIDYGRRRCGIAVTDALRIVATALATVDTRQLIPSVKKYVAENEVDAIIVGLPVNLNGAPSDSQRYLRPAIGELRKAIPQTPIIFWDERFTSTMAHQSMLDSGMRKMQRRDKAVVDRMAAVIILNSYLESKAYKDSLDIPKEDTQNTNLNIHDTE